MREITVSLLYEKTIGIMVTDEEWEAIKNQTEDNRNHLDDVVDQAMEAGQLASPEFLSGSLLDEEGEELYDWT